LAIISLLTTETCGNTSMVTNVSTNCTN